MNEPTNERTCLAHVATMYIFSLFWGFIRAAFFSLAFELPIVDDDDVVVVAAAADAIAFGATFFCVVYFYHIQI